MAFRFSNRAKETTSTTGTGSINLSGASTGFRSFVDAIGNGNTCAYLINDGAGNWECGVGTVTDGDPDTLSRDTVLENSLGTTAKINFGAGTKDVFCTFPAELVHAAGIGMSVRGMKLSNNGTDGDHDVDIAAGACVDRDGHWPIINNSSQTIAIDGAGLSTGTVAANTVYGVWAWAKKADPHDCVFRFDPVHDSQGSPTAPSGYETKRLIGFVVTDASANIIAFAQQGDYFRFTGATIQDVSDNTITSQTFEVGTLSVPANCLAHIYGSATNTSSTDTAGSLWVKRNGAGEAASFGEDFMHFEAGGITFDGLARDGFVMVDGSRQIQYAAREASGTLIAQIRTLGCDMLTRSNP